MRVCLPAADRLSSVGRGRGAKESERVLQSNFVNSEKSLCNTEVRVASLDGPIRMQHRNFTKHVVESDTSPMQGGRNQLCRGAGSLVVAFSESSR